MSKNQKNNYGSITSYFSGVAYISGFDHVFIHEVLVDEHKVPAAIVIGFSDERVEALLLTNTIDIEKPLFRSYKEFSIPVSDKYEGRIINGLGLPIDNLGPIEAKKQSVFQHAPFIIDRQPVTNPLTTGIKIIDTNLPLGRGQRELLIGDRKLGKSTIATDIILNQKHAEPKMHCIYVICGQKKRTLEELISVFEKHNAFLYSTIVAATASDSFAEQYLAPFIGCTIGEYYRDQGKDALVIYDDLTQHAKIYRSISLLLERAPGREVYPGDIFSLHANLLERAAKLSEEKGGGSLTAIPIIETQEDDITAFIPTNLISITDGQIYLERGLMQKGFIPAVNVGLSVSRVGAQVQPKVLSKVLGGMRLALSQHKELQKLSQLETIVSKESKEKIHRGELILELLKQEKHTNVDWPQQTILFYVVTEGIFDDIPKERWSEFELLMRELVEHKYSDILKRLQKGIFNKEIKAQILQIAHDFKNEFALEST